MDRIDTHHHILPQHYAQGKFGWFPLHLEFQNDDQAAVWKDTSGIPKGLKLPEWSPELSLEFMARHAIGTSILSISAPATSIVKDKAEAASLAREINIYAASLRDKHPSKFGFFSTLPSPKDMQACLEEISYCFDVLKADGVTLLTSYNDTYLGHPDFRPLWEDLDRRAAVVFIHPTADIHAGALQEPWFPPPMIDFPHETTRTAVHLIISNTVRDHPNCKIILSHGGGTLPYVATRLAYQSAEMQYMQKSAHDFIEEAKSFYFDLALTSFAYPFDLLLQFAQEDHILYGSDYPFAREKTIGQQTAFLDENGNGKNKDIDHSVRRGAALKLFPRLAQSETVAV